MGGGGGGGGLMGVVVEWQARNEWVILVRRAGEPLELLSFFHFEIFQLIFSLSPPL